MGGVIRAMLARVHEPQQVTAAYIGQHTLAGVIGAWFMCDPPGGQWVGFAVGLIAFAGAATAGVAAYAGAWWLERVGLWAIGLGYFLTLLAICLMPGLDRFFKVLAAISVAQAILALVARYGTISWAYLDPMRPDRPTG